MPAPEPETEHHPEVKTDVKSILKEPSYSLMVVFADFHGVKAPTMAISCYPSPKMELGRAAGSSTPPLYRLVGEIDNKQASEEMK